MGPMENQRGPEMGGAEGWVGGDTCVRPAGSVGGKKGERRRRRTKTASHHWLCLKM